MVKLLTNPILMRMAVALFVAIMVMVVFIWLSRRLRASLTETSTTELRRTESTGTDFTLAAYQGVIQKYKDQEKEVARQREEERQKAARTEKINTAVLTQLSSGVVLFNKMGLLQQANPAARSIFGYASPVGFHARDLFKGITAVRSETKADLGPGPASLLEALDQCIQSGQSARRLEADYVGPQSQQRVLGITLSCIRDPEGQALGVACLTSDLTEISELARQMRTRENLASLGEMSAGIAHEFKNSLATISGYAQMLSRGEDASTVQNFAEKITGETASLTRIVTDFLNFAKPGSDGGSATSAEVIHLGEMLQECARASDVDLSLNPEVSNLTFSGDSTAWRQAFSNLLRNSAEAAREGQRVQMEVTAERQGGQVIMRLRDNGRGIPEAQLEKIFIPFFTTKDTGTGLGLALVHRIVTQHGGSIKVASDDSGTEFTIAIPANIGGILADASYPPVSPA